ncbi:MAG: NAD(P)-dependent oxidoreductase [Janthinobacterium lividum]
MQTIGVVGLGNMGRGMVASLLRGGYAVCGYDALAGVAQALASGASGGNSGSSGDNSGSSGDNAGAAQRMTACASIADLVSRVDLLILSLPTSAIVEQVTLGADGVRAHAKPGLIVVDTTTAEPASTRRVAAALRKAGIGLVDAPVSGGPKGAATATMTMVLGGADADVAAVEPVLAVMSAKRVHVGPVGAGHVTKILNNMLTGIHLLAAAEAVRAAQALGVDPRKLVEALNGGSGRNSATLTNYPTWIFNDGFDSGFTMKLMRKDVRLGLDLLAGIDANAPLATASGRIWAASAAALGDAEDFNRIVQFDPPRG